MGLKYTISTGEVIELDIDDVLQIGETPEAMQEILAYKDLAKKWPDADSACEFDELKFFDEKVEDDFDYDLFFEVLEEKIK